MTASSLILSFAESVPELSESADESTAESSDDSQAQSVAQIWQGSVDTELN